MTAAANSQPHPRRVLAVQHGQDFRGGVFVDELEKLGCHCEHVYPAHGDPLPADHAPYDALVAFGGPQSAWDDASWPHFQPLMGLMRDFDAHHKPVAGICLGSQILARAHGGQVRTSDALELGYVQLTPTEACAADPVLGPSLPLPRLFEFHQDRFIPPPAATLLAAGEQFPHQAFRVGACSYGFQFHLEVDAATVSRWVGIHKNSPLAVYAHHHLEHAAEFYDRLAGELPELAARSEVFCRQVVGRWLQCGVQSG